MGSDVDIWNKCLGLLADKNTNQNSYEKKYNDGIK
jgi:hypothetical protein